MKKICSILIAVILSFGFAFAAFAQNGSYQNSGALVSWHIENDKITYNISLTIPASPSITKSKTYSYYDSSGELQWMLALTGAFSFDGTSAECTSASTAYKINDDTWKVTSATVSRCGNTAKGNFTVQKYYLGIPIKTIEKTLTLTCSPIGLVS